MIKKFGFFVVMVAIIAAFGGCQKEELNNRQLTDDEAQPQVVVKPDVYVENDYLVFKDFETLDSIKKELNTLSTNALQDFEAKQGFKSAFSYRQELLSKVEELSESKVLDYLNEISKQGYFDQNNQEFIYPFHNESYARILNPNGKLKIGKTFYRFEGTMQIIAPDLTDNEINGRL